MAPNSSQTDTSQTDRVRVEVKGAAIPALGLGTWDLRGAACERAVGAALSLGYRHIDTARMYGNEAEVGAALAASGVAREEVFLTTKLWSDELRPETLRRALPESLRRLRCAYVDLLLIHWPSAEVPLEATLDAMSELQDKGLARHLGVSNFPRALIDRAAASHGDRLVCNQLEYHPFLSQATALAAAEHHDLALTAYCPLARGRAAEHPLLREIAAGHGRSGGQVALRWLIQQPRVVAIPKAASPAHLEANLAVFDFALSAEEMAAIGALAEGRRLVDPASAPAWDRD